MNSTKTKIRSSIKKDAKNIKTKSLEIISIPLKQQQQQQQSEQKQVQYNVIEIAKNLKSRLSNVAKRLTSDPVNFNKETNFVTMETQQMNATLTPTLSSMDSLSPSSSSSESSFISTPTNHHHVSLMKDNCTSLPLDSPPTSPIMLAKSDWSDNQLNNTTSSSSSSSSSLYHLQLLKQYLTFVSQETNNIELKDDSIQFTLSNESESITPESDIQKGSRLGATLIELSIHDPTMKIESYKSDSIGNHLKHPNGVSRTNNRRRPGRPPKSIQKLLNDDNNDQLRMKNKRHGIIQRHQSYRQQQQQQQKKKESIDCICNVAHEEFGTMVQCDDCLSWLHLDCLELNEKALQETFRCPSCFIKFGANGKDHEVKLLSTVTWRYAAKYQSEVLAAGHQKKNEEYDDEEEEFDEDEDDIMELDNQVSVFSYKHCNTPLLPVVVQNDDTTSMFDLRLLSEDWCDNLSNSSQDGYSEAGTPSEYQVGSDDYWFAPPSAANVFLWENNNQHQHHHHIENKINLTTTSDIEPSAICAQELPKFNFWDVTY